VNTKPSRNEQAPDSSHSESAGLPVAGVVPMAGQATRLAGLTCSKEILPTRCNRSPDQQPVAVCEHLLGQLQRAGIHNVYITIREGKWDIPAHLEDGSRLGLHLAYLMMGRPFGTPYSVDQAYPFIRDRRVALGFPDMCFGDPDIFTPLLRHQESADAHLVLGIFPADRPHKVDMVELGPDHRVKRIVIKPAETQLQHTWGIAVWTPVFTEFMHSFLDRHQHTADQTPELYVGDVVRAAIQAGLDVQGVPVSTQPYIDIGTREDLERVSARP
jgi:glucose-1-phosphate thymidylyltransferase